MQVNPYLHFNGQCEAAFKFYEKTFGGKIAMRMTFGESPMAEQSPPDWRGKIMHIRLMLGDTPLMGSDAPPERYQKPQGFTVTLNPKEPAEAERIFNALADGGTVG